MFRCIYCFLVIVFAQLSTAFCQSDSVKTHLLSFVKSVNAFNLNYPQEKVYLHFDNTGYFIGENMWFKAYVVSGPLNQPTTMSGVLYVELLTPEGRIVQSNKLKIEKGQAQGRFQLGHLLHAGYYEVRAYTRMMLNWDSSGIFSRVFPIFDRATTTADYINPKMTIPIKSQKIPEERPKPNTKINKINMLFFPEGGNLVAGLQQNIAFKIFTDDGRGQNVDGYICDSKGNKLTTFVSLRQGIGKFSVTAYEDEQLSACFTFNGKDYTIPLPHAESFGYVITASQLPTNGNIQIALQRNVQSEENTGLAISCNGNIYIFQTIIFHDNSSSLLIEPDALREGVNQIVLFNEQGQILCRRMIFIRPKIKPVFTAKFDKSSYKPFDKVSIDFQLKDSAKVQTLPSTFSLAVRDVDTNIPGSHTGDAATNLLLSSDLKGFIEKPEWYFEADDDLHNMALDNLMLTQGWYRYKWQEMTHPETFKINHFIEDGLIISGKLSSVIRHREKSGAHISITLYDKEKGLSKKGRAIADSLGHFAFKSEDFYGRWQMYIRTSDKNQTNLDRKEMEVHLDRQISPDVRAYEPLDTWMYLEYDSKAEENDNDEDLLDRRKLDKYKYENLIPETTITASKRWMEGKAIKSANIVYDLEEERTREDDTGTLYLETLFEYLERTNKYFTFDLELSGRHSCYYKNRPIQWIIDNDDHSITDIETLNIKNVEAILINDRYGAAWGHDPLSGSDSINVASAGDEDLELRTPEESASGESTPDFIQQANLVNNTVLVYLYIDKNAVKDRIGERNTVVQGYTKYVDFYSPDYEYLVLPDEKDFRRTLYWNPSVNVDDNGKAKVVFYNNGQCSNMEIDATTVTQNGGIAVLKDKLNK